jgi:hypothetical protein
MAWKRIVDWKIWGRLANLIIVGTIYGFHIFIYDIQKIVFLSQRIIKRFRKRRQNRHVLSCINIDSSYLKITLRSVFTFIAPDIFI